MPATTPIYKFPYPAASDTLATFPTTIRNLALSIETEIARISLPTLHTITPLPAPEDSWIKLPPLTLTATSFVALSFPAGFPGEQYIFTGPAPGAEPGDVLVGGAGVLPAGTYKRWAISTGVPDRMYQVVIPI